ncbi:hypothetical protein AB0L25_38245 [Spirillospora sp. NPDC052242]
MDGGRRAERRTRLSERSGMRGRRAARRLFASAARGDEAAFGGVVRIAGTPGHRLRDLARDAVACRWAARREEDLRRIVLETGSVALGGAPRLLTLALLDRLDEWPPAEAGRAPDLLADPDPDVRERTAGFCRGASGPMRDALWEADTGPGTPLRAVLLENAGPPPAPRLDTLWSEWLDAPTADLTDALLRWGRPATGRSLAPPSIVAVNDDGEGGPAHRHRAALLDGLDRSGRPLRDVAAAEAGPLPDRRLAGRAYRRALLDAIDHDGHPLGEIAARKIAASGDRDLADDACERALERPGVADLCERHGLVPYDGVRRAAFLLVTGQAAQYRALDPDGGLLALAYAAASDALRARLREAMPAAGDLDLVRVILGEDRRARIGELPEGEARYLADRLAGRREWDELWSLIQKLPIALGVEFVRLFDGWAPRDADERRLFALFRDADADDVRAGVRALADDPLAIARRRFTVGDGVTALSFAPSSSLLAVATADRTIVVLDVRTGGIADRYTGLGGPVGALLHLGDALIAGAGDSLVRCAGGRAATEREDVGTVTSLAATGGGGFVATTHRWPLRGVPHRGWTAYRPAAGPGPDPLDVPRTVAAHPQSGRFAVLGRTLRLLGPGIERTLTAHSGAPLGGMAFLDADTLVCVEEGGEVTRLRVSGGGAFDQDGFRWTARARTSGFRAVEVLAGTGRPVVLDETGALSVLDGSTFGVVARRPPPDGPAPEFLAAAPGGDLFATADAAGAVDVFDPRAVEAAGLVCRPLADALPRHLAVVAGAAADPPPGPGPAALRLLAACLEHRFRLDVELAGTELADTVRTDAGEHDIGL